VILFNDAVINMENHPIVVHSYQGRIERMHWSFFCWVLITEIERMQREEDRLGAIIGGEGL
jgi:hypothetical protein